MTLRQRSVSISAVALALFAIAAAAARAAESAGTQSVFAYGAGDRAIAMGSAFVASANDASALYWNPAGLGLITRSELQFNQSADLGLGFRESYAAMAMPNWRWGTFGLTLRHFGVGGIERRDDRNVSIGGDVSDSEVEMALGYGRTLGETWSVGGAAKLQRQSVAGFSGSGLGVDLGLGVQPPWARTLRFGIAVRNAVEPSIRLDRESLPDPITLRTGVAYKLALGGTSDLLAEIDLEKPRTAAGRILAGLEYRLLDQASLRLGLNGAVLTAGSELRWRNWSIDYAFENNPLAFAQRAGLSLHFGSTVEESRLAARRAEDEGIQRRLAEAFQQRQSRQIEELLDRGEALRTGGQYDEALEALGSVLTLDPSNAVALTRQVQCLTSKAALLERAGDFAAAAATYDLARSVAPKDALAITGAARCRAESDRRAARTVKIRALFASAMDALAAEDLAAARDRFADVLARDTSDAEAARMLARTRQALTRRAGRLVDAAQSDLRAGLLVNAAARLDEATKLDSQAPGLAEASAALARARQAADNASRAQAGNGGRAKVGREGAPSSRLPDREIEQLYALGLAALRAQRTNEALQYWEHVWSERPGYRGVGDLLKREYLARGMESFASGKLEEAVSLWEKVLRIDPNDARAQGYLDRARKQITRSREILGFGR